ncbi:BspA family leucine-rich repeat surface protein [Flavobacteriaceae bacterium]|nr:BspA family leucine-rich repeat surface protein [Flavobacteriaceae bacterium]
MKKLLYIFLGLSLIFACSDDGDGGSDDTNNPCPNQPQLTTYEVSEIEYNENTVLTNATFSGEIQNIQLGANCETFSITNQGFVYSTTVQPTTSDNVVNVNGQNPAINIANLSNETTYYVRTYLTNTLGTFYGNEVSFTTLESLNTPITDANFIQALETCFSTNPIDGMCSDSEYGALPNWDVSQVTDMSGAFANYTFNGDISAWDVSNVTHMVGMFYYAISFNQDISAWDVSSVTDMSFMFKKTQYPGDISSWDVSNVTNMESMFAMETSSSQSFNGDISAWDVSSVTNMKDMFFMTRSFTQDIGSWNVSNVTNMDSMFYGSYFNGDISAWDVSNVSNMFVMFMSTQFFNQDLSSWEVNNVTNCQYFSNDNLSWTLPKPNFTSCNPD